MKLLLILSMVIIILLEVPRLVREKLWRELGAFSLILVIAYALALMRVMGINFMQ